LLPVYELEAAETSPKRVPYFILQEQQAGATVLVNTMQADPAQKISVVFTSQNADFVPGGHALIFWVSFLSSPSDISPSDH
jgi:hypothetical protein